MPATPIDQKLYNSVKRQADKVYDRPSAYKSGYMVKRYKELGGKYVDVRDADSNKPVVKPLQRWFREKWQDIGHASYPVYRPTRRISRATPLTADEIDPAHAKRQITRKQRIRERGHLPPFRRRRLKVPPSGGGSSGGGSSGGLFSGGLFSRGGSLSFSNSALMVASAAPKSHPIWSVSDPVVAQRRLNKYVRGHSSSSRNSKKMMPLYLSSRKEKKYMILVDGKKVHFGQMGYQDFLKHRDARRRANYLTRSTNIRGNWKRDRFSPNNLAIHVLW